MTFPEVLLFLSCVGVGLVVSDPVARAIMRSLGYESEPDLFGTNLKRGSLGFTVRGATAIAIGFTAIIVIKSAVS